MGLNQDIKQKKFKSEFEKVIVNIIYTRNWFDDQQTKIFKPLGLTSPQYNVLRILRGQYPNHCTVNLIIDRMLDRMSNVSRIVDKLVSKKLVSRSQNNKDRRAVDVAITEEGLILLGKIDIAMGELMDQINSFSDQDCQRINTFLDQMRSAESNGSNGS